jgi:DNA-binding NtrC family response regulator
MHKVLVIDDDEMILMMLRNALEDEGYRVLSTADGPQGVSIYKEHHPSLVLLDLGLPSVNGMEVLKEIRSIDPKARVIVISGYGAAESVSSAIRFGAWDFIEKSADMGDLLQKIRAALSTVQDR